MNQIKCELKKIIDYLDNAEAKDISIENIEQQLALFENGVKIPQLAKPCTIGDGIVVLHRSEFDELLSLFDSVSASGRLIKFVPASGAASRMFHKLQSVLNRFKEFTLDDIKEKIVSDNECKAVYEFLINLKKFSFYDDLKTILNSDDIKMETLSKESPAEIIKAVLFESGLNYSSKPKGAIKFHRYKDVTRTAFEEQIYEAFHYISDKNGNTKIHFTISEAHTKLFNKIINSLKSKLNKPDSKIDIRYSYQKKSTDTIAVDHYNKILFDKSGNPIHRPGGHGALLENLNDLIADIVIIKNIDNVSTENLAVDTILYKKLLIGYLTKIQNKVFDLLNVLDKKDFTKISFNEIINFTEEKLYITKPIDFDKLNDEQKHKFLFDKLNRPIRICGMVKNVGEPGGGPFWVNEADESLSLQIIEQSQINMNDKNQKNIFRQSTHFNPVDLICGVKNYKGENFNLHKFVDHHSGIITKRSKDGVELKALELPGLWNGSMANWITIFVEVPISTFNPVKEVNDLLRAEHQN
ncbi:MAG: DUF4301 family protein [Ignavibacteriaceae bacterium]|nr:DUF4301 family protein [Ignavibacterium sp.]MCC6253887.1 DUF4301 family protein [Ignavibacteriaceae bacterium]HMN23083.1 DUF4301 family protein [Ignavibacteriaceae bacterium]HRN27169.1 DUF4301 family protein [Ignavibacteriaceae bacterium]HRP93235.1 DUF4301 family protein [Ignavibacteriaceae bacterium]